MTKERLDPADLLGTTEVARLLDWDRRKVATYHGRGLLPKPVADLAATPIWRRQDIAIYATNLRPVVDANGHEIDYAAAVNLMDDELREELHAEIEPCPNQRFLEVYAERHRARFGEDFAPYRGGAW